LLLSGITKENNNIITMFDTTKMSNPFSNWNQKFNKKRTTNGTALSSWTTGSFNSNKLKVHLKLAIHRFQMASNKKSALLKQSMREIAVLLAEEPPKEEKARIKVESLIRDDYMIEAYDILSLNCELLSERIKLIQLTKECPPDLVSCIATLMYAAPRVDGIPELVTIRQQFLAKYGTHFDNQAMSNVGSILNERVVTKLSIQPPAAYLVQTYLEQICEKFEVDWSSNYRVSADQMGEPIAPPTGYSVPIGNGTGLGGAGCPKFIAHSGMTVNGDDDDADDDDDEPLPPHHPYTGGQQSRTTATSLPPDGGGTITRSINSSTTSTRSGYNNNVNTCGGSEHHLSPTTATSSSATMKSETNNDSASIFSRGSAPTSSSSFNIPEAPSSFVIPAAPGTMNMSSSSANKRDDDDNSTPPPPPLSSSNTTNNTGRDSSASYDDMAARFEALKNL